MKRPDWLDRTVVCIASGPSLTPEDAELVHASGHPTVVTNSTFRIAPWCDMIFGFDWRWWEANHGDAKRLAPQARRVSHAHSLERFGVETTHGVAWFEGRGNSGCCAIAMAVAGGARRIVLLGYDCQLTGGRKHWHADHAGSMTNCVSLPLWPGYFGTVAAYATRQKIDVVNATRETSLKCFRRGDLVEALR